MSRSSKVLPCVPRSTGRNESERRSSDELHGTCPCRNCAWEPVVTEEVIREFGFSRDDAQALETVAEALFRSELSDDAAVAAFDRVFGWCAAQDFGNVDVTDETMALIRARRAS